MEQTSQEIELKRCPFCGGKPFFYKWEVIHNPIQAMRVECEECYAQSTYGTQESEVAGFWNQRI